MKTKKMITAIICLLLMQVKLNAQDWSLTGNAGTDPALNFIGTTDAKAFKIKTNNQVRVHIKSNGDIGIGTSSPTSKFHVNGVITAIGGTSDNWNSAFAWGNHASAGYLTAETDPQVGVNVTNYISKWNGTALVTSNVFDNGTNIGIGTATPTAKLEVNATSNLAARFNGNNQMYISFHEIGTQKGYIGSYSGAVDDVDFGTNTTNATGKTHLTIQAVPKLTVSGDNVGIGTTTPSYPLHVSNSTAARSGHFTNTFNSASTTYGVYANTTSAGAGSGYGVYGSATGAGGSNYGLRGFANAGDNNYGVYGFADGGSATTPAYGIYGTASGSENYWAGYFNGTTYSATLRIGTTDAASGYIVSVGGKVICEELKVELEGNWPDYVFHDDYKLKSLDELEKSIKENKHLPGMPSAKEIDEQKGFHVGEMQSKLLEKIEEQALYILQLKKEIDAIKDAMLKSNEE